MSNFSYQIPTLREIEESLERTWEIIKESESLTQKQLMSSRLPCNRCHLCCSHSCCKVPIFSRPLSSSCTFSPNPALHSLHYQNLALAAENRELSKRIEKLSKNTQKIGTSYKETKTEKDFTVKKRIFELEEQVDRVEKEFEQSLGRSYQSTAAGDGFNSLSREIDKTEVRFKRLTKKIETVEKWMSEPKDRHCARCLPKQ